MIFVKIKEIIGKQLQFDKNEIIEINWNGTLEEIGCDSLDSVEISMAIEEEFDIIFTEDELNRHFSGECKIKQIIDFIELK